MSSVLPTKKDHEKQIYETWAPIIEAKFGPLGKKRMETLCRYAHCHSLHESIGAYNNIGSMVGLGGMTPPSNTTLSGTGLDAGQISLLPMCLEILAKVQNLDEVKLTSGADGIAIERHQVSINIPYDLIQDLKKSNIDSVAIIEEKLVIVAIKYLENAINMELNKSRGGDIIYADSITIMNTNVLIESIMTISEGTMAPKMAFKMAFGFKTYL